MIHPLHVRIHPIREMGMESSFLGRARLGVALIGLKLVRSTSVEDNFYVGALLEVHGVDEADLAIVEGEDQRMGARALAEKADAAEQAAAGDTGTGED